jgi:hypothetical protein
MLIFCFCSSVKKVPIFLLIRSSCWYCLLQSNIEKRNYWSQQCALIAVDELLLLITYQPTIDYWNEVKHEIEKL